MDFVELVKIAIAASVPVLGAAWVLSGRLSSVEATMRHLSDDVGKAVDRADRAHVEIGTLRERLAVVEARCSVCAVRDR